MRPDHLHQLEPHDTLSRFACSAEARIWLSGGGSASLVGILMRTRNADCPTCGAGPGEPCRNKLGKSSRRFHLARFQTARMVSQRIGPSFENKAATRSSVQKREWATLPQIAASTRWF